MLKFPSKNNDFHDLSRIIFEATEPSTKAASPIAKFHSLTVPLASVFQPLKRGLRDRGRH